MLDNDSQVFQATAMPDRDWWQTLWPRPDQTLRQVGVMPGMRVVDLCSGDGYFTVPMSSIVGGGGVVAIEIDEAMLSQSRSAALEVGADNITFIHGDAMEVGDLVPDRADAVVIANTFHGASDHTDLARSVRRALEPGGTFVVINWWPRSREETPVLGKPRGPRPDLRFSPQQVAAWVEPAGFELTRVEEVGPYHYGAVFTATPEHTS